MYTLGLFPARSYCIDQGPGGGATVSLPPFEPVPRHAVAGDRFFFGSARSDTIRIYSPKGIKVGVVTLRQEIIPITSDIRRRYREVRIESVDEPCVRQLLHGGWIG